MTNTNIPDIPNADIDPQWNFRPYAAKSENAAELQAIADSYRDQFQPQTAEERCLLTFVIIAQWHKHRWINFETRLLDESTDPFTLLKDPAANALLKQVDRRISAEDRRYHRALADLHKAQKAREPVKPPAQPSESKPVAENWLRSAQSPSAPPSLTTQPQEVPVIPTPPIPNT